MAFPVVDGLRAIASGSPGEVRRWLVGPVVNGGKRATAGPPAEHETQREPLEHVGARRGTHVAARAETPTRREGVR